MAERAVMGARGAVCSFLFLLASAGACSTEYNRPIGNRTPSTGSGGSASPSAGGSAGFPVVPSKGGSAPTGTGGRAPGEPPGESVLTFVNGIVDAKAVVLCLTEGTGSSARGVGAPFPEGGLEYGAAFVLDELDELGVDEKSLSQVVIAGELELLAGLDCAEAVELARSEQAREPAAPSDTGASGAGGATELEQESSAAGAAPEAGGEGGAGGDGGAGGGGPRSPVSPPRLRVGALPIVPAGTLSSGYSMLLVGTGCIGGPAFAVDGDEYACGAKYTREQPTLSGVLVRLGRAHSSGRLGLQVLHASLPSDAFEVRTAPLTATSEPPLLLTAQQTYGELTPEPPRLDNPASSYGASSSQWAVQVTQAGSVLYSEPWSELAERSALTPSDGRTYTLVFVGPALGLKARFFWNEPQMVLIDNDPTRAQ